MSKNFIQSVFETSDPTDPVLIKIKERFQDANIGFAEEGNEPRIDANGASYFDIKIKVQNELADKAFEIIRRLKSDTKNSTPSSFCPNCDDNRIVESEAFCLIPWITNKKFKCMNCGFEWKKG